ncbi:fumarylacetoacetate hydrolase family protein [Sphingobium sp. 15-1]|uniref:fumarylacetoacetate hydrolase family protein n=1 Tax=Sphingobium sp. 15-1 TaxID=2729616 RepID=UPI00159C4F53|nr:fumarylacetoacetate hydrolase family protein [Sphingobium sp. 15-1]
MKLVTFSMGGAAKLGAIAGDLIIDVEKAAVILGRMDCPQSMQALIDAGDKGLAMVQALVEAMPEEALVTDAKLLAPLPRPVRFRDCCLFLEHMEISVGKIARAQAEAAGSAAPQPQGKDGRWLNDQFYKQVIYYNADHLHVHGHKDDIVWPVQPGWADYELEWACVVGRGGRDIDPADARAHIFGFTIFNDWSARDLQIPFMEANLGPGEGKDFANSFGPCIATIDEFADPYKLRMTASINGEIWSSGTTSSMHHRFEDALVQFSRGKELFAGEIIGSGTVLGGCGLELDKRLAHGDVVELEVEGIGVLRNRVLFPEAG